MTKLLLTDNELNSLNELKGYFKDSIDHIDSILKNVDIQTNLNYIIHDHEIDSRNRNEIIKKDIQTLKNLLNKVEVLNSWWN